MKQGVVLFIAVWVMCMACAAQKNKKGYELPAAMSPAVATDYSKQCEQGKVLYAINCGACHNKVVKRKTVIPDFTADQLKGYELRVANPKHESSMPDTKVTAEELGTIMIFLSYKTKSNYPFVKKRDAS